MKLEEAIKRVREFRGLQKGWDSYGAEPIQEEAIQYAESLLLKLGDNWQPVPCSDGGIQLERHMLGEPDVEIYIFPREY